MKKSTSVKAEKGKPFKFTYVEPIPPLGGFLERIPGVFLHRCIFQICIFTPVYF
jgi:hypothetical protein